MKCTTKIVLGIIAAIFALSILFIIYAAIVFDGKEKEYGVPTLSDESLYTIPQGELKTSQLESFNVVCLEPASVVKGEGRNIVGALILRSQETDTNRAEMIVGDGLLRYIHTKNVGDTLKISLDCAAIYEAYENEKDARHRVLNSGDITLSITNPEIEIISRIKDFGIIADGLAAKYVKMSTNRGDVKVASGKIAHLNAESVYGYLSVNKSSIDTLTLDLDNLSGWNVANSRIDVENLTGSRYHSIRQSKTESNTVNWIPKNKSAELNIAIPNDTVRIIFP